MLTNLSLMTYALAHQLHEDSFEALVQAAQTAARLRIIAATCHSFKLSAVTSIQFTNLAPLDETVSIAFIVMNGTEGSVCCYYIFLFLGTPPSRGV